MGSLQSSLDKPSRDSFKEGGIYEGSGRLGKLCQEPGSVFPGATEIVPGEQRPGLRMEAEHAGRVPERRASFWPGDPLSVSRSPATPEAGAGCPGRAAHSLPLARSISPAAASEAGSVPPPSSSPPTFFTETGR